MLIQISKIFLKILYHIPLIVCGYKSIPDLIQSCGPVYVKLAQIATTRQDILPESLIRRLKSLQDHVPVPVYLPKEGLTNSGSIALIYEIEPNKKILKIKRPNIDQEIQTNIKFLTYLLESRLLNYLSTKYASFHNMKELLTTLQLDLNQHLDFEQEASNQIRIKSLFNSNSQVLIPKVYSSNQNEIVMEKINGVGLDEISLSKCQNIEIPIRNLLESVFDMIFVHRVVHCDLHEGNILVCPNEKLALLDFAIISEISEQSLTYLIKFFLLCIQKDYSSLADCITSKQTISNTNALIKFKLDMKQVFDMYEFNDTYRFLNKIIQTCLDNRIQLEHTLLGPLLTIIQAEGIARKYTNQSFISLVSERFNLLDLFSVCCPKRK